jgi:hypothetical protein
VNLTGYQLPPASGTPAWLYVLVAAVAAVFGVAVAAGVLYMRRRRT